MDAVILDVGGVLLVPHAETVSEALEPLGVRLDDLQAERAHFLAVRALDAAADERQARLAYLVAYADAVEVPEDQQDRALACLRELWARPNVDLWRQRVRGSAEGLNRLAATGVKLGIVSNADGTIEEQLRRGQICQIGEGLGVPVLAIIDSGVVGVEKPAADIFRHALDPLGVTPEQAIYIGDTVRYDVRGARAAGLHPVHFDPYHLCGQLADHPHVATLAEVASLVHTG